MATPLKIALTKMKCLETTSGGGSDEPYVLVFSAQLKSLGGAFTIPGAHTTMYGPWDDADKGDLLATSFLNIKPENCWGLDGKPAVINSPNDVIILVALMENDDATPGGIRTGLHAQLFASLTSYSNSGMSRASMVQSLKKDMKDILKGITVTGFPSSDDLIGVTELALQNSDLVTASAGNTVVENLELAGDGGKYKLRFEISKG